jgi:hypothetical protein
MRNIHRSFAAVLMFTVAVSVGAATRTSGSPNGILQSIQRFVIRVASRVSPPGGYPTPASDPTMTTTDPTTKKP